MKAPVLHAVREPIVVEDVEIDEPRAGEVLVKMAASGVCHSCLHAADGSWEAPKTPMVLGDEGAGIVDQVGPANVVRMAQSLGITSPLQAVPSITLGTQNVSVMEMADAYLTFANEGMHSDARVLTTIGRSFQN